MKHLLPDKHPRGLINSAGLRRKETRKRHDGAPERENYLGNTARIGIGLLDGPSHASPWLGHGDARGSRINYDPRVRT